MTVIRGNPADLATPALRKEIVLKTVNGQLVASSWPRRRGPPTSPAQIEAVEWLKWSARIFPYIDGLSMDQAIEWTKGTGLYPRDLVTMALKGNLAEMVFEDGSTMQPRTEELECLVFNGAILQLGSNAALAGGVTLFPSWPLPLVDTFSFWNAGAPERFTIPIGVSVVQMTVGGRAIGAASTRFFGTINSNLNINVASQHTAGASTKTVNATTGPIEVSGGDWFRAGFLVDIAMTLDASQRTFFTIEVLQSICP